MSRSSHQKTERRLEARDERGFRLIELLGVVASAPTGWTPYTAGTYSLSTSGDSVVVSVP